ncbi:DUF6311 domain-containing protein [Halopseudomonas bauzanensis]|uniref:DUF6311 domain-containing protein n=1 Tax=Halopseudomonas bauzanensis TaxID=653930 RepID=UPI0025564BB8|nr:DUF6311 domain-containing protein [Halopseudomonas bauzanensis]
MNKHTTTAHHGAPIFAPSAVHSSLWIPILLGTILFFVLGGLSILAPSNTGWLMRGPLDPQTNLFGWEYFRETPWLQFPLGANPKYGMEIGSSIIFSDSLPLFALLFKLLDPLLPETFQYFGLWVLTCVLLQAIFSYLVLSHFTTSRWLLGLGTALLLLLPPYLMRFMIHLALGGQWLLLAGLYLYFSPAYRTRFWLVLLALAPSIHAYLLIMLAAIWGADLLQRLLARQLTLSQCIRLGLTGSAVILSLMWCLGYFMLGPAPTTSGQYTRMNLLALVDPGGHWSTAFPGARLTHDFWDGDGFAYMGLGMLGLLATACLLQVFTRRRRESYSFSIGPITAVALLLLFIAVTNTIKFGSHVILEYELPQWAIGLYQTFRAPGRMFWPAFYLLSLMAIVITCTRLRPKAASCLLGLALSLQIYDLSGALKDMHSYFRRDPYWATPLDSPLWDELGQHYEKVLYIKPAHVPPHFVALTDFALRHGMPINSGNFARIDDTAETKARALLAQQVSTGRYDPTAIYIFNDDELWDAVTRSLNGDYQTGTLNGVKLLLPGIAQCPSCSHADFVPERWGVWSARQLPSLVGQMRDDTLLAQPGDIGYLSYGPYTRIPAGTYSYRITYKASATPEDVVGHWDIVSSAATTSEIYATGELTGSNGNVRVIQGILQSTEDIPNSEIRIFTNGSSAIALISIQLQSIEGDGAYTLHDR